MILVVVYFNHIILSINKPSHPVIVFFPDMQVRIPLIPVPAIRFDDCIPQRKQLILHFSFHILISFLMDPALLLPGKWSTELLYFFWILHCTGLIHLMKGLIEIRNRYHRSHKPYQKRHSPNLRKLSRTGTRQNSFSVTFCFSILLSFILFSGQFFRKHPTPSVKCNKYT